MKPAPTPTTPEGVPASVAAIEAAEANRVAVPTTANLATIQETPDQMTRFKAYSRALEAVDDPRCPRPIPRFMLDMPWSDENDPVSERIIAAILSEPDPWEAQTGGASASGKDLVGRKVEIHDMRVHPSDKPGGWGAYLLCDAVIGDRAGLHKAVTVGAKQAVALLALAWFQGDLPITGTFTVVTETGKGNTVLGFIRETPLG